MSKLEFDGRIPLDYAEARLEKIWIEYGDSDRGTNDDIRINWSNGRQQWIEISGRKPEHLIHALNRTIQLLLDEQRCFKI